MATPSIYLRLRMRRKDQTNWMSNKPVITSDSSKLQYTHKFTNYQRITHTDIHYVYLYAYLRIYAFIPSTGFTLGLLLIQIICT
jgi:hypothetical protein